MGKDVYYDGGDGDDFADETKKKTGTDRQAD
jgi:hypothetical protein